MKVLHLKTDVGGNAWGLSRGERALGLESDVLISDSSSFQYPADRNLHLKQHQSDFKKWMHMLFEFWKLRTRYNVFHFNAGSSFIHKPQNPFFNQFDLPFYPKNAKIFATYNGCDARQKYPTMQRSPIAACHNPECYQGACNSGRLDNERRLGIEKMSRYAQHIWALNPDLLYFLPKEKSSFLPYTVAHYHPKYTPVACSKSIKVVHAPTNRAAKGTDIILSALDRLQKKYPGKLEVLLVENVSHEKALRLYQQADLLIDQVLIGWYGALAVETMLMGKPVVARIAEKDLHFIPPQMAKEVLDAIISVNPATLFETLAPYIENPQLLKNRSEQCFAYATKWHHPEYVASLTKEHYLR